MTEQNETVLTLLSRQLRPVLWHTAALSFFINLLVLPVSLYSLQVFDRVMATGSLATLFWLTAVMILLFAVAGMLQSLRGIVLQRAGDWLYQETTNAVLPVLLTNSAQSGNMRGAQGQRDATLLKQFIGGTSITTLMDAPWSVLFVAVLFLIHWTLGVLVLVGAFALLALAWLNESMMRKPLKQSGARQLYNLQDLEFATRNADVIEAMGITPALLARWNATQQHINDLQGKAHSRSALVQGVTKFMRLSLQVLVTAVSAWLAIEGVVTIGAIIAASILASRALAPFETAIGSLKLFTETRQAYTRLQQLLAMKPRSEGLSLPVPHGHIAAENLSFGSPVTQQFILKQVNFTLEPGESLGIIGPSGSGKSTLGRLIVGILNPSGGIVRLDGANVYTWPREEFGQFTGYLPQDVELFSGTVKDNIARLAADAPAEAIVEAAQMANAHELILRLPKGYETDIGNGGSMLSSGQKQRIGLARAFYGTPRLLVLDEPDANLDDAGRHALMLALKQARLKRITTIIISHRKSVLAHTDKMLMLRDGMVEGFAPTSQALAALSGARKQQLEQA